jgi:hypothetical protein
MFHVSFAIPWIAVLVAGLALQALGAAWFMAVVPKPYAVALGRSDLAGQKPAPIFIVGPLVCGLVVTVTNAILMRTFNVTTVSSALVFGAITALGYLVSTTVNVAINPNIPRPLLYGLVTGPFYLIGNLMNCAILAAMT